MHRYSLGTPFFVYEDDKKKGVQKTWQVPKDFELPKCNREMGWKFWLVGMPNHRVPTADGGSKIHPICPFRFFELKRLPERIRRHFRQAWRPVFTAMQKDLTNLPDDISEYNAEKLNATYQEGTESLRRRAEYAFLNKPKHHKWTVATWSKQLYTKGEINTNTT